MHCQWSLLLSITMLGSIFPCCWAYQTGLPVLPTRSQCASHLLSIYSRGPWRTAEPRPGGSTFAALIHHASNQAPMHASLPLRQGKADNRRRSSARPTRECTYGTKPLSKRQKEHLETSEDDRARIAQYDRCFETIDHLQRWNITAGDTQRANPLGRDHAGLPQRRRIMHCHDFAGGYKQSADEDYLATFSSWEHFDLFVYFSHHRVVVPPYVWIQRCHQEHKIILGTFLFEGKPDSQKAEQLLETEASFQMCADKLVDLCVYYGFDGWLVNVETDLVASRGAFLSFLQYFRRQMKHRVGPHAQVIYYDAHDENGVASHQNALIPQNKAYFDACDGIFINYRWFDYGTVARSKREAGCRQYDVYAGVDVWARDCKYDEGPDCKKAVESATEGGVSVAIFAPGWVQEKGPGSKLTAGSQVARSADCDFWREVLSIGPLNPNHRPQP